MKINHQILHLPPFISTSWSNITSLHLEEESALVISLINGPQVRLPPIDLKLIQLIFEIHLQLLDQASSSREVQKNPNEQRASSQEKASTSSPSEANGNIAAGVNPLIGLGIDPSGGSEGLGGFMQHAPENAHAPDLPAELLERVAALSKTIGLHDTTPGLPKAEPHCNCHFCQIARAMSGDEGMSKTDESSAEEEEVSDEDLKFRNWDIQQTAGTKLFTVTNPLDEEEYYSVFLGDPIGCTCGTKNCEHIRAVLQS